ncbi:hypothetical protein NCM_04423 [Burkholderia pseudomallei]
MGQAIRRVSQHRLGRRHRVRHARARALLGAFAPNRLVWGSDWPHTQHRDRTDYQTTRSALDDWVPDPSLRRIILCDSARALFRFDRQTPARDT